MSYWHLSDIHVGAIDLEWAKDFLTLLLETAKMLDEDPIFLVTGDVTDDGYESQYRDAYKLFDPFEGDVLFVPGNHDYAIEGIFYSTVSREYWVAFEGHYRSRFLAKHKDWSEKTFFGADDCRTLTNQKETIILVDTIPRYPRPPWAFARGELPGSVIQELDRLRMLGILRSSHVTLAMHHHPFDRNWFLEMRRAEQLTYNTYGYVDLVLFGHSHGGERNWHVGFARVRSDAVKKTKYLFQRNLDFFRGYNYTIARDFQC